MSWKNNKERHSAAARGIRTKRVGFTNLSGLLGESPKSVEDILAIRDRMVDAKLRNDIDAMYIEIMKIVPYMEDENSNIEYIYSDESMFYHPDSPEDFKRLYDRMFYFKKIGDIDGLYMTTLQLLPDRVKEVGDKEDTSFFFGNKSREVKTKTKKIQSKGIREDKKPKLKLVGEDGNAFYILGKAQRVARKNGMDWDKIRKEATSSDYDNLLRTMMKYFDVY